MSLPLSSQILTGVNSRPSNSVCWVILISTYRFLSGVGTTFNILMLMIAKLVGYSLGLDGMKGLLSNLFGSASSLVIVFGIFISLFVASQLMFEVREQENSWY